MIDENYGITESRIYGSMEFRDPRLLPVRA